VLRVSDRSGPQAARGRVLVPGMRRVQWVRFVVADGHTRCEAVGTGHRLPTVCAVSLDTALALVATGVPSVIRTGRDQRVRVPTDV